MLPLRKAACLCGILLLITLSACGAPAATEAPGEPYYEVPATEAATEAPVFDLQNLPPSSELDTANPSPYQGGGNDPYDMFFQDYGVNPLIDTVDDALSTFALDVDTGSYTIMRNYLRDGNRPPPESVRVEEYVNYFDQGYSFPPFYQAFQISIDGAPSPFTQTESYQMMRIVIQGYDVSNEARAPASLTFVIDVSGSMDMDNRLGLVKGSLELLVEQLRGDDTVGIVVYGSDARIVLEQTPGSNKGAILSAIYSLRPEGSTNAEAGIQLGYRLALSAYKPDGINRVILCSDGVANVGNTGADAILSEIRGGVEEGVTMTTVGFGMDNYNDILMEQLADNGNGFYAYVDDMEEARRLFIDEITGTLQTIALDAKVQVDFNPEVVARYRLVGFENRAIADNDFRDNTVDAGEIGAGHSVTALYEIKLHPGAYGRIATVLMRWEDPDSHQITEVSKDFDVNDLALDFREADPYFQRSVVVAEYAEILKRSYWAEGSSLRDVRREAERIGEYLYFEEAMQEFLELIRVADSFDY